MTSYYFAYGANTNLASMARRCPAARSLGAAKLLDHEFRFAYHADVVPSPGAETLGVLWEVTEECLADLDAFENVPDYYLRVQGLAITRDSKFDCWVYVMVPGIEPNPPSTQYLNTLLQGYREHRVDINQIYRAHDTAFKFISDMKGQ